jgi:hypothetical protein
VSGLDDTPPELEAADRELAAQLESERAMPNPSFRGALGRHLTGLDPGYGPRPAALRIRAATWLAAGALLLLLAVLIGVGAI